MQPRKRDDTATLTATRHKVSASYVRRIVKGTSTKREDILNTYNSILAAKDKLSNPAETADETAN